MKAWRLTRTKTADEAAQITRALDVLLVGKGQDADRPQHPGGAHRPQYLCPSSSKMGNKILLPIAAPQDTTTHTWAVWG